MIELKRVEEVADRNLTLAFCKSIWNQWPGYVLSIGTIKSFIYLDYRQKLSHTCANSFSTYIHTRSCRMW